MFAIAGAIGTPIAIMAMANVDRRKVLMLSLSLVVLGSVMILVSSNLRRSDGKYIKKASSHHLKKIRGRLNESY